jgi:GTP-binding protein Era
MVGEQDLKDEAFFKIIHSKIPVFLLLNKIDNSNQEQLENKLLLDRESA